MHRQVMSSYFATPHTTTSKIGAGPWSRTKYLIVMSDVLIHVSVKSEQLPAKYLTGLLF